MEHHGNSKTKCRRRWNFPKHRKVSTAWATATDARVREPMPPQRETGWTVGDAPASSVVNYWMGAVHQSLEHGYKCINALKAHGELLRQAIASQVAAYHNLAGNFDALEDALNIEREGIDKLVKRVDDLEELVKKLKAPPAPPASQEPIRVAPPVQIFIPDFRPPVGSGQPQPWPGMPHPIPRPLPDLEPPLDIRPTKRGSEVPLQTKIESKPTETNKEGEKQ